MTNHIITTVILCFAFVAICFLMIFLKNSKTYNDAANMPLDDEANGDVRDETLKDNIKREE